MIIRILFFIDPIGIHMIYDPRSSLVTLLIYFPGVFVFGASILTVSVWLDVLIGMGKKYNVESNFTAPKIISAVLAFLLLGALIAILVIFHEDAESAALYSNIVVILCGIIVIVFVSVYLPLVEKKFSKSQLKKGVQIITRCLLICCGMYVLFVFVMVGIIMLKGSFTTNDPEYVWLYYLLQVGVRITEMGMIGSIIFSTLSIPPKSSSSTKGSASKTK
eukprot:TRINITY_DN5192_c0_g2_i2.p1 TRINITY_DN5192_c0_g2~~TRINITY_DN5192_c0_g2_i2.p1  ORF type:complete len:219 (-),score=26.00 TRINITY_DN5192_c0_g2_i2:269-925(-)